MPRNKTVLMTMAVLYFGTLHADALALGVGPGGGVRGGKRGGRNGPRKDPKKEREEREREAHNKHVQQMPQLEKCAKLDVSYFDGVSGQLDLSNTQEKQIGELKQRLGDKANGLEKAAETARDNFKNTTEPFCPQAGGALMAAIQACKNYAPSREFESGVGLILNENQRKKLKMLLLNGGRSVDVPNPKKDKVNLANE